jgi:hypothetical protein
MLLEGKYFHELVDQNQSPKCNTTQFIKLFLVWLVFCVLSIITILLLFFSA